MVDVDPARVRSIFALGRIQSRLETIIGRPVDVVRRGALRPGDLDGYMDAPQITRDAVERCFSRISEAAYKLGNYLDALYPNVDWGGARPR